MRTSGGHKLAHECKLMMNFRLVCGSWTEVHELKSRHEYPQSLRQFIVVCEESPKVVGSRKQGMITSPTSRQLLILPVCRLASAEASGDLSIVVVVEDFMYWRKEAGKWRKRMRGKWDWLSCPISPCRSLSTFSVIKNSGWCTLPQVQTATNTLLNQEQEDASSFHKAGARNWSKGTWNS